MYALSAITLLGALAYAHAGGLGLAGSIDGAAILSGPSGVVQRTGLAAVGPIAAPGAIIAGAAVPGAIAAGPGFISAGLARGAVLTTGPLGLGLAGVGPGLAAKALGLQGSGIEGQYVPDINEKLYDDGSYKPGIYGP